MAAEITIRGENLLAKFRFKTCSRNERRRN